MRSDCEVLKTKDGGAMHLFFNMRGIVEVGTIEANEVTLEGALVGLRSSIDAELGFLEWKTGTRADEGR